MAHPIPFESVTLERHGCFGTCPVYDATIFYDGSIQFEGKYFVEQMGKHQGKIDAEAVERLERLIQKIELDDLQDDYPAPMTDQENVMITIRWRGKTKSVHIEGSFGPKILRQLQDNVEKMLFQARWDENGEIWTEIAKPYF